MRDVLSAEGCSLCGTEGFHDADCPVCGKEQVQMNDRKAVAGGMGDPHGGHVWNCGNGPCPAPVLVEVVERTYRHGYSQEPDVRDVTDAFAALRAFKDEHGACYPVEALETQQAMHDEECAALRAKLADVKARSVEWTKYAGEQYIRAENAEAERDEAVCLSERACVERDAACDERDAMRDALQRIADMPTSPRPDGTYNYSRNALVDIARDALAGEADRG